MNGSSPNLMITKINQDAAEDEERNIKKKLFENLMFNIEDKLDDS